MSFFPHKNHASEQEQCLVPEQEQSLAFEQEQCAGFEQEQRLAFNKENICFLNKNSVPQTGYRSGVFHTRDSRDMYTHDSSYTV